MSDLLWTLLHTARALEESFAGALGEAGVSLAEYGVLSELVNAGHPLAPGELARRKGWTPPEVRQLVDRLEARGLVRRHAGIAITTVGRERHRAGAERLAVVERQLADLVPRADRRDVERALSVLRGRAPEQTRRRPGAGTRLTLSGPAVRGPPSMLRRLRRRASS